MEQFVYCGSEIPGGTKKRFRKLKIDTGDYTDLKGTERFSEKMWMCSDDLCREAAGGPGCQLCLSQRWLLPIRQQAGP